MSAGHNIEYTRRLYDDVRAWYDNADAKAQVVLGIDGAFLAFLTSALFSTPDDLRQILGTFSPVTWILLALMVVTLAGSIAAALICLWSRIYSDAELKAFEEEGRIKSPEGDRYTGPTSWFFQIISVLKEDAFKRTLLAADAELELEVMTFQILKLSGNVRKKHAAVNWGFRLAGATLFLFLAAGISYAVPQAG